MATENRPCGLRIERQKFWICTDKILHWLCFRQRNFCGHLFQPVYSLFLVCKGYWNRPSTDFVECVMNQLGQWYCICDYFGVYEFFQMFRD